MSARTLVIIGLVIVGMLVGLLFFPVKVPHIQLPAEPIAHIGGFAITNTMLTGWLATLLVLFLFWRGTAQPAMVPSGIQNFVEYATEFTLGLCESVAGVQRGRQFFPLVGTIFFFVLTANWMGLLPGYGTIGIYEKPQSADTGKVQETAATKEGLEVDKVAAGSKEKAATKDGEHAGEKPSAGGDHAEEAILVPFFRSAATDLNTTLAIALVAVIAVQIAGVRALGGEYVQRFFNLKEGPIGVFVGLLELVAEFGRILSFTFRLFGNIFAGEVVLGVITFLVPWVATIPFLGLELFVGFIQALVFAMLTLVFLALATTSHQHHDTAHSEAPAGAHH